LSSHLQSERQRGANMDRRYAFSSARCDRQRSSHRPFPRHAGAAAMCLHRNRDDVTGTSSAAASHRNLMTHARSDDRGAAPAKESETAAVTVLQRQTFMLPKLSARDSPCLHRRCRQAAFAGNVAEPQPRFTAPPQARCALLTDHRGRFGSPASHLSISQREQ
jgi:hypothetical protein